MSGISDRVHVFKEGEYWRIESPTGRGYRVPDTLTMEVVQAEAIHLHDHPEAIHAVGTVWVMWCPICARQKNRVD